jgi:predicted kinase
VKGGIMSKKMWLLRGCPGSGKDYLALRLVDKSKIFSTDEWFDLQPGGYLANWSGDKLSQAHWWNQQRTREAMLDGITPLVINNTNLTVRTARPYVEMADQYGYSVEIREPDSPWWLEISQLLKNKADQAG